MKNLLLVSLFFIGVISTNDDVWKPTNDYHLKCSDSDILYSKYVTEGLITTKEDFKSNTKIYAHYNFENDYKYITFLEKYFRQCYISENNCLEKDDLIVLDGSIGIYPKFNWENVITKRFSSDDTTHTFIMKSKKYIGTDTRGVMKERNAYAGDLRPYLNRENLEFRFKGRIYECSLITAAEYLSGISVLKEKRDSLTQAFVEKGKSKLKV